MDSSTPSRPSVSRARSHDTATGLVAFLGLYQGVVPLVARLVFDADQRLAPALWLPSPWWWIACLGIILATLVLLAAIDTSKHRHAPAAETEPDDRDRAHEAPAVASSGHDALSGLVFLVGIYNGVAPFVVRLILNRDDGLFLSLPLRLSAPWWWLASLGVIAASIGLLAAIDRDKQRRVRG